MDMEAKVNKICEDVGYIRGRLQNLPCKSHETRINWITGVLVAGLGAALLGIITVSINFFI